MAALAIFVTLYALAAAGLGWLAARLVPKRWPWLRAPVIVAATAVIAVACLPVPTHGGLILLGPELAREAVREWRRSRAATAEIRRETRLDRRFVDWLPADAVGDAWRDPATGLVWTGPIGESTAITPDGLAEARARCAGLTPAGYWAVPRTAEFFWLARTDHASGRWLADAFLWPEGISLPTLVALSRPDGPVAASQPAVAGTVEVRCVAVTPPAPIRGYRSDDVPLAEWNAFQVGLTNPSRR
jgi:hypothetical protein